MSSAREDRWNDRPASPDGGGGRVAAPIGRHEGRRAPFLVLAHHRSGSNFLNDLLQSHPRVECVNEPLSMHTRHFRERDLEVWTGADFDARILHASLAGHGELRNYLLGLRDYLLSSTGTRVIGFKETVLFGKLEWLHEFMPTLKIIFLRRDPRSIVSSLLRSDLLDFWRYSNLVPAAFERAFPGIATSRVSADPATRAAEIATMSVVARYELATRSLGLFDHQVIDLEEILAEPEPSTARLVEFLEVERHDAPLQFMRERTLDNRGGLFSSFRRPGDVAHRWKRDLQPAQVEVIEDLLAKAERASRRLAGSAEAM